MTDTLTLTSLAEYIASEEAVHDAPKREYEEGVIIEMTGGSINHAEIIGNLAFILNLVLRQQGFRIYASEMRVRPPTSAVYYYPDLSVVAGAPLLDPAWITATLLNPCLIVEVLSPSTATRDRGVKFTHYQQIPSLQEYLLVDSEQVLVEQWQLNQAGVWPGTTFTRLGDTLTLGSVPATLALADIYRNTPFTTPTAGAAQ